MMEVAELSLREALATNRLEDFVKQAETHGVALEKGSEFERALALLALERWRGEERSCNGFTRA